MNFEFRLHHPQDRLMITSLVDSIYSEFQLNKTNLDFETGSLWVIENDQKEIVGSFGLLPLDKERVEFRYIYLKPEVRGLGLGKKALGYLMNYAMKNQFKYITLETSSSFKTAIYLYEKQGFYEINKDNKTSQCDKQFEMKLDYGKV